MSYYLELFFPEAGKTLDQSYKSGGLLTDVRERDSILDDFKAAYPSFKISQDSSFVQMTDGYGIQLEFFPTSAAIKSHFDHRERTR